MKPKQILNTIATVLIAGMLIVAGFWVSQRLEENRILRQMVSRLSADSRIAEVLVTKSEFDEESKKILTTIKFLEYDTLNNPLPAKYFTFLGNIIQFQALVVRFQDQFVKAGDKLRGKSAYIFTKVFAIEEGDPQIFEIAPTEGVPSGYKIPGPSSEFEKSLWKDFWKFALDPEARDRAGIKNVQIEAPGSLFRPGTIYTLRIEHDGGLRIDSKPVPEILKGEKL